MTAPSPANPEPPFHRRNILVTGATGKQGSAFIKALLSIPPPTDSPPFYIYALTRNPNSPSAISLLHAHGAQNLTLIPGDLNSATSINYIFSPPPSAPASDSPPPPTTTNKAIYGVFAVLAYPGLGANADGEERQGKLLVDAAARAGGVKVFVYSSIARSGPKYEEGLRLSGRAKREVEEHVRRVGGSGGGGAPGEGFGWTIIRPGFFMENFENFIGSIGVSVLRGGLKKDTEIGFIAADDIGGVAAGVFRNPERYNHKILVAIGEFLTISQVEDSYKRATGNAIPAVPQPLAWFITKTNTSTQNLLADLERHNHVRKSGEYPELDEEIRLANEAFKMRSYYEYVKDGKKEEVPKGGWNGLSLPKLLTGRF